MIRWIRAATAAKAEVQSRADGLIYWFVVGYVGVESGVDGCVSCWCDGIVDEGGESLALKLFLRRGRC